MKMKELIAEAVSLPVEERAILADTILRSLNQPEPELERKWAALARRRLAELRSGRVKAVSAGKVFGKIGKRFST